MRKIIIGKNCSGKSTYARKLASESGVVVVELDKVILSMDDQSLFVRIYSDAEQGAVDEFIAAIRNEVAGIEDFILEGAVSNPELLAVLSTTLDAKIISLHPAHQDKHMDRVKKRFLASSPAENNGLPKYFWERFTKEQIDNFYKSGLITSDIQKILNSYAAQEVKNSSERIKKLQKTVEIEVISV